MWFSLRSSPGRRNLALKAQPFPLAMTLADVREWLAKVAWKAAPIKILGGGSAIISAEEGPSSTFLPLNDGFVFGRRPARTLPPSLQEGGLPLSRPESTL